MRKIRTYSEVTGGDSSEILDQVQAQQRRLARRLDGVGRVVAVASGKGGVGKSAVTANLAAALARRGRSVGVVDADLNGPSMARMLGAAGETLGDGAEGVEPARGVEGIGVISMELLQGEEDAPLRWKGPEGHGFVWESTVETGVLREFISDVHWGELDYMLLDIPPGTQKIRRLLELVPDLDRLLLVTIPSELSRLVVSRSVRMALEAEGPEVSLVANMTEYVCPDCGESHPLFPGDGAEKLASETELEIWARVPFDPRLGASTDAGRPGVLELPDSPASLALTGLAERLDSVPRKEERP